MANQQQIKTLRDRFQILYPKRDVEFLLGWSDWCGPIIEFEEFAELFRQRPNFDFIYDIPTKLFLTYVRQHAQTMSQLYELHTDDSSLSSDDAADEYVLGGHGIFRSSVSPSVWIHQSSNIPDHVFHLLHRDINYL